MIDWKFYLIAVTRYVLMAIGSVSSISSLFIYLFISTFRLSSLRIFFKFTADSVKENPEREREIQ